MSDDAPVASINPIDRIKALDLEARVVEVMRTVYDPEIPVNIYDLGLIYGLDVAADGKIKVRMTLTSPMCPVAGSLPGDVQRTIEAVDGVTGVTVDLVWDPPWSVEQLSEAARLQLGIM